MDVRHAGEAAIEILELRARLEEAEQTLRALRTGEADALVVYGEDRPQVYTLKSASEPYRMLVEQMHEGALTLSPQGVILYCNEAFVRTAGGSTHKFTGSSVLSFIAEDDFKRLAAPAGSQGWETVLRRKDGSQASVLLSSTRLRVDNQQVISAVVTDLTHQQLRLRYEAMVEAIAQPIYSLSPELIIQSWNPGAEQLYGYTAAEINGRPLRDICCDGAYAALEELVREVRRSGCARSIDTCRKRKDGSTVEVIFRLAPLLDGDGRLTGYAAISHDITQRKAQEKLRQLLFEELNHRVKNTLAIVQSIARFTERQCESLEDFGPAFSGRIQALAGAHSILTTTSWEGADLRTLAGSQLLLSTQENRFSFAGPEVKLQPQAAINLALVIHELGTNAGKYGALSVDGGHVDLTWGTPGGCILKLRWAEAGGPRVSPRTRRGFGSFVIEESLNGLGGRAVMNFEPAGLVCDISFL